MSTAMLAERYAANLHGVLSCYAPTIVAGTLPGECYADGMSSLLYAHGVRIFDYPPLRIDNRRQTVFPGSFSVEVRILNPAGFFRVVSMRKTPR